MIERLTVAERRIAMILSAIVALAGLAIAAASIVTDQAIFCPVFAQSAMNAARPLSVSGWLASEATVLV